VESGDDVSFLRAARWSRCQTHARSNMLEMTTPQRPRHGNSRKPALQKTRRVLRTYDTQLGKSIVTRQESAVTHQMKSQCLLRRKEHHTTAWVESRVTKLGLLVELPELGGLWEIVEIYPYRLSDEQLKTRRISTVILPPQFKINRTLNSPALIQSAHFSSKRWL
jgi:hypothetical protein